MIYILDAVMGTGKTTAAINYMNEHPDQKFIYITPFLEEVSRVRKKCRGFCEPDDEKFGTKLNALKYLMGNGVNIVSTHAMFHNFDKEVIDLCYQQDYTLILDEVADVVAKYEGTDYKLNQKDKEILLTEFTEVDDKTGILHWREDQKDYTGGKYDDEKILCEQGCLACYNGTVMLWLFPIDVFKVFSRIFILTYLFDSQLQRCYFDYYNLEYNYIGIKGDSLSSCVIDIETSEIDTIKKLNYSLLINVLENDKLNRIGDLDTALSKNWYIRNKNNSLMKTLKNNVINFFIHICSKSHNKSKDNLWTTFKDYKYLLSGNGYAKGFESCNCRATNKHRNRSNIAYLVNRYIDPNIVQFFVGHNIRVDEDGYALSEMLQFIWRSAIRDGNQVNIYIPSSRMRKLLCNWIIDNSKEN